MASHTHSILCVVHAGTEDLPALWPVDGSVGEEGGANGEQPSTQSQGEQDTGVLWKAIPRDPQAERAAGALPEVIVFTCDWSTSRHDTVILLQYTVCLAVHGLMPYELTPRLEKNGGFKLNISLFPYSSGFFLIALYWSLQLFQIAAHRTKINTSCLKQWKICFMWVGDQRWNDWAKWFSLNFFAALTVLTRISHTQTWKTFLHF